MATEKERNRGLGAYSTPGVDVPQPGQKDFTGAKTSPTVSFKFQDVDPPSALYITENDQITLIIKSSQTLGVVIRTRILRRDGVQQFQSETFQVTGNRTGQQFGFNLTEGYLLGVQLSNTVGGFSTGQIYVQCWFTHGGILSGFSTQPLFAGYLRPNTSVGWPSVNIPSALDGLGFVRSIVGTTPAAGAEVNETVPTGARWRLQSFSVVLNTSATVANRQSTIVVDDGVNIFFEGDSAAAVVASSTARITYSPGLTTVNGIALDQLAPTPSPLYLMAGWRLRTVTLGLQAGDQYASPKYSVEEWIEN